MNIELLERKKYKRHSRSKMLNACLLIILVYLVSWYIDFVNNIKICEANS
jgi:hypothetical protein